MKEDLVQTPSPQAESLSGHLDFEAKAREVAGKLVYPIPAGWVEANRGCVPEIVAMHEAAADANAAAIAAALSEAVAGEREACLLAIQKCRETIWERMEKKDPDEEFGLTMKDFALNDALVSLRARGETK